MFQKKSTCKSPFFVLAVLVFICVRQLTAAMPPLMAIEETAAPSARVLCHTTKGDLTIDIHAEWAPLGAAHFIKLVEDGFYTDIAMYRSVESFLTQFGISDKPQFTLRHRSTIPDDTPKSIPIRQGYLSFAGGGPNSRTTQTFIAYEDLEFLGKEPWETPFGKVPLTESNKIVLKAIHKLGDIAPFGPGPDQTILSAMLVDEVKITEADHRRELLVQDALKVNTLNVGVDHIKHLEDTAEALSREAEKAAESLQVLPGMHNIHKHVAEHARRSIELLRAKKAEEDMRRARGEIVTEELTPEELQRLERDARKHNHQPMEVPPLEAAIIVLFIIAVAFGYQWSNKALLRDAKRQ